MAKSIALLALVVSAAGLWLTWKSSGDDKPTRVVEKRQAIPLTLRGKAEHDGRSLTIEPVEPSHALESLTLTIKGASPIEIGSDGELDASDVETALKDRDRKTRARTACRCVLPRAMSRPETTAAAAEAMCCATAGKAAACSAAARSS